MNINSTNNYSYLFQNLSGSTASSGSSFSFSDYASIKNGSYGKLLKAYYSKQKTNTAASNTTASTDSSKTITSIKTASAALSKTTEKLRSNESDSLFAKKDMESIQSTVKDFVKNYNSLIQVSADSKNNSILNTTSNLTGLTSAYSNLLNDAGITIGTDNKLTLDETALKKASIRTLSSLFHSSGSYASAVESKSSFISIYAQSDAAKASGTYTGTATYSSSLNTGNLYNSLF